LKKFSIPNNSNNSKIILKNILKIIVFFKRLNILIFLEQRRYTLNKIKKSKNPFFYMNTWKNEYMKKWKNEKMKKWINE
jgi:hypothetical protein